MRLSWTERNRSVGLIDVLGLCALGGFAVARFIPVARLPFWGCALRKTTGWPCPTCGLTRVADRLAHFSVASAWDANPLGTVAALSLFGAGVFSVLHLAFKLPVPVVALTGREARRLRIAIVGLVLVNYALVIIKAKFPWLL